MHEKVEKRLFLIDGYGFVFRAFHSLPPLTAPDGTPVGAVYGFTNMLMKLKNRVKTVNAEEAYLICVFDAGKKTFRQDMYAEYKANRPPAPEPLIPQFPLVREAAKALCIESMELDGFEADDIIATYTRLAQEQGIHVTIVSGDKDLMQLVTDDVKMYDGMRDRIIGIDQVVEKFGVGPEKVLDILSLMGDSSDNIPGVPGVGPKTATDLVKEFGSLDGVYENIEKITKKKLKENLVNHKADALLSRDLVRLKDDVAVEQDITKFKVKPDDIEVLRPFLEKNGFKSLLAKIESKAEQKAGVTSPKEVKDAWKPAASASVPAPAAKEIVTAPAKPVDSKEIASRAELAAWLPPLNEARKLAIAAGEDSISIAKSGSDEFMLKPIMEEVFHQVSGNKPQQDLFSVAQAENVKTFKPYFEVLKPYLESGSCNFIFHDLKSFMKTGFAAPKAFDDILVMNYSLYGTTRELVLEGQNLATQIFNIHTELDKELFADKVDYIYADIEKPLVELLHIMESNGIKVDKKVLTDLSKEFGDKIKILEKEIHTLANEEFNIGSPKQLGEVLFEHMGIQGGKKTKTGYATGSDILEELAAQGHSIAGKVLEWRGFSKLANTYTDALQKDIDANTGRIHTTFRQAATTTGRLSSVDPNLQNIPIRTEEGRKIRSAFVAEEGNLLIGIDYSQIELRLLAHVAKIEVLQAAFANGKDIHAATASQVFGVDIDKVDSEMRRRAKTINFGIIYGQSAFGLANQLGIPRGEAKNLIDKYFAQYPGIKKYMEDTILGARENGYVSTIWGRKIYLPGIADKNPAIRNFNERAAINAPLQGTAADIIKRAMILIGKELHGDTRLLLQIHDELILEAPAAKAAAAAEQCKKVMENVISLSVPLVADARTGKTWAEIH